MQFVSSRGFESQYDGVTSKDRVKEETASKNIWNSFLKPGIDVDDFETLFDKEFWEDPREDLFKEKL